METESEEIRRTERKVLWRKIGFWSLVTFGALLSYAVLYPAIYLYFEEDMPLWLDDIFVFTLIPLEMLYGTVPMYENLIDWLAGVLQS